jgi:hypothetical protein
MALSWGVKRVLIVFRISNEAHMLWGVAVARVCSVVAVPTEALSKITNLKKFVPKIQFSVQFCALA